MLIKRVINSVDRLSSALSDLTRQMEVTVACFLLVVVD